MKRFSVLLLVLGAGVVLGRGGDGVGRSAEARESMGHGGAVLGNGDVNGDGVIDISDASALLNWLFLGGPAPSPCISEGGSGSLPDTGQTICRDTTGRVTDCASDTCPGQDGFYQTGCSTEGRYIDNGDGTVTDNCTGLMWQKESGNDGNRLDWCSALSYCENLELAGHDDWRLPNVLELLSIADYRRLGSAPVFGVFDGPPSFPYWSSTYYAEVVEYKWTVTPWGRSDFSWAEEFVRAVR